MFPSSLMASVKLKTIVKGRFKILDVGVFVACPNAWS